MASLSDLVTGQTPTGRAMPRRSRLQALALATALGVLLIAALAWVEAGADYATRPAEVGPLGEQDLNRLGHTFVEAPMSGVISVDAAREAARAECWQGAEPSVPRASLVASTDEGFMAPVRQSPIWILRYPVTDQVTPNGDPIPFAYVIVHAQSGACLGTHLIAP